MRVCVNIKVNHGYRAGELRDEPILSAAWFNCALQKDCGRAIQGSPFLERMFRSGPCFAVVFGVLPYIVH